MGIRTEAACARSDLFERRRRRMNDLRKTALMEHRRDTVPAPLPSGSGGKIRALCAPRSCRAVRGNCDEAPSWPRHTQRPRGTLVGVAGAGALRAFPRGSPETRRANDAARRGIDRDQAEVITNARRKSPFPWMARCSPLMLRVVHTPCSTRSRSPRCSRIATAAPGERRPHRRPRARTSPRATRRPPRAENASCQTAGRARCLPPADGPPRRTCRGSRRTPPPSRCHRPGAPARPRHRGGARDDQDFRSPTTLGAGPGGLPRDRNTPKIETRRISDLETLGNHEP